jgi:hypothetical protein
LYLLHGILYEANILALVNKEVIKELPTMRNFLATATRVLQCTLGYSDNDVFLESDKGSLVDRYKM